MAYGDTYICPACSAVVVEDDQMWVDPHRCPSCGAVLHEPSPADGEET